MTDTTIYITDDDGGADGYVTWHDMRPDIEDALSTYRKNPNAENLAALDAQFDKGLNQPSVKWIDNMLVQTNNRGQAYSSMDQGDMGVMLIRAHKETGVTEYLDKGIGCIRAITTNLNKGGLKSRDDDGSWFHGVTTRETDVPKNPGGTLNKHLFGVRSLADAADALPADKKDMAENWRKVGRQGIAQLASGHFPSLKHYFVGGGQPYPNSWAYYSMNIPDREGRFLDAARNGSYHMLVMRLLERIDRIYTGLVWDRVPLAQLKRAYMFKMTDGGLYVDSKSCPDGDFRAVDDTKDPLSKQVLDWFDAHSSAA